jgi:hypothetical protein
VSRRKQEEKIPSLSLDLSKTLFILSGEHLAKQISLQPKSNKIHAETTDVVECDRLNYATKHGSDYTIPVH